MKKSLAAIGILLFAVTIFSGCTSKDTTTGSSQTGALVDQTPDAQKPPEKFSGTPGTKLALVGGMVQIETAEVSDGDAHFFNTTLSDGSTIYYFVVQDKNGVLRAAANACAVCHDSKLGFVQEGDSMKCKTCGNKYPLEKIATEKGGCNPGPINPNLQDEGGIISISEDELMEVADLFI